MGAPFRAAHGVEPERNAVLVRVVGDGAEGWGECAALTAPTYTAEYVDAVEHVLVNHLVPRVIGRDLTAEEVGPTLAEVVEHRMAKSAIELAVLDAELRLEGRSLAGRLGAVGDSVPAGVGVGVADTVGELVHAIAGFVAEGYGRVKMKIHPGWDVEPVRAVRDKLGNDLILQVDANGAYRPGDIGTLQRLDGFGLAMVEQPFPADALLAHAELARRMATPICLDDSIVSAQAAADAIALKACRIICVKPGRVGGYLEAVRIHDVCRDAGIPVWVGGMLETGIARAANLALAALPGFTLPGDLSASTRWFERDITVPLTMEGGRMRVPKGPGIGIEIDPDALEALTVAKEWINA